MDLEVTALINPLCDYNGLVWGTTFENHLNSILFVLKLTRCILAVSFMTSKRNLGWKSVLIYHSLIATSRSDGAWKWRMVIGFNQTSRLCGKWHLRPGSKNKWLCSWAQTDERSTGHPVTGMSVEFLVIIQQHADHSVRWRPLWLRGRLCLAPTPLSGTK